MKSINKYINEGLTNKQRDILGDFLIELLKGSKLSSIQLQSMFNNVNTDYLKNIGDYLLKTDNEHAIAYVPVDDEYLKSDNKDNIVKMFAEYFDKYITNI